MDARVVLLLLYFLVVVALIMGWVVNIIEIIKVIGDPITAMFILRCAGIFFAPLGGVLGYI